MADFQPLDSGSVPRFAGPSTFMRLPMARPEQVDIALIGVPFDGGTTNRPGARHGPREIRNQSSLVRRVHHVTGLSPFEQVRTGDCGDVIVNPLDLPGSLDTISAFFKNVHRAGARPLVVGGDHLITLPILRGIAKEPAGLIHFDAHSDTYDEFFGNRYNHGTPFRRAVEEGLLDPKRMVQIGIRGAISDAENYDFAREAGIRIIVIEEFMERGVDAVMAEARSIVGEAPAYVSFDIDALDPSFAPGTGTPEIGGITTREAQKMVRALAGVDIIGADLVEVSPPLDPSGVTALTGATLLFELLCVMTVQMLAQ
ncbi:agmatinase [Mesorhizobium sp. M7A.F.Ca.AU.002.06.1.1]|nr:agmatinase [Mesorhizobium ciceri]AMY04365.1 agmatinase [Mesorhizobium ciceri biovar biserrulae]RUU15740.1 agmatinase [Mesorhizobium sp. Primo-B]RUU34326.1 agmatinase [Mesorhizobium sp. Primo-A]RVB82877.1 agmatinase [Mesorhizobium sp. M7A.F.Ca.AU.002.04.1.1]RVB89534.1 agmatinase [Mesorhizobium sp. M7A.F.Ca.AU.002.03.1.1]RVB98681.1 agmatinase [Mesorhizobium sp. M7A.F.Ca.AU.002.06.1.1]RVC25885.1 agmatinase [Mesorhizobium sp. M7A.F.Ca.AU.002.02.1.1]TPI81604.1 agmatinase [Mesorhizobium sp. B2